MCRELTLSVRSFWPRKPSWLAGAPVGGWMEDETEICVSTPHVNSLTLGKWGSEGLGQILKRSPSLWLFFTVVTQGRAWRGSASGSACGVGVLDLVQGRSHSARPRDLESVSVRAGDRAPGGAETEAAAAGQSLAGGSGEGRRRL